MPSLGQLLTCALFLLLCANGITADFKVPSNVEARLGSTTTLRCRLEGYYRWYVISWIRRQADGSEVTIVRLPSDTKTPEWDRKVDYGFKSRIRQKITVETDLTEFNLVLKNVKCEDRGLYVCMFVGRQGNQQKILQLSVKVEPVRPSIHYNYLVIEVNSSFVVECQAQVGYPPKRLTWLYKPKDFGQFKVIANNRPIREKKNSDCDITVIQPLEIFANTNRTGLIYRCAYEGEYYKPGMYDEVSVQLPATVEMRPATVKHDCMKSGSCAMEAVDDGFKEKSSSDRSRSSVSFFFLCTALISFL